MKLFSIHREGHRFILMAAFILFPVNLVFLFSIPQISMVSLPISFLVLLFLLYFFRDPGRRISEENTRFIYAPADGKIVALEKVFDREYLQREAWQVSIFMSPVNVHINWNPCSGKVIYKKIHPGKYLVAWHPKSSTENERTTVVIDRGNTAILIRQIAGVMARRIINYLRVGERVSQGSQMGFIKFGSRVDVLLPLDAAIKVSMDQQVRGNKTILAHL